MDSKHDGSIDNKLNAFKGSTGGDDSASEAQNGTYFVGSRQPENNERPTMGNFNGMADSGTGNISTGSPNEDPGVSGRESTSPRPVHSEYDAAQTGSADTAFGSTSVGSTGASFDSAQTALDAFEKASQEFDFNTKPILDYAEQTRDQYRDALKDEKYAKFDKAVETIKDAAADAFKREAEPLIKTAEYVTGLNRDELAERIAQKSPLSKKYDITGGDSSYSQYLTSKQPAMNAGNAKDSDYNVLSQLAYADKFSNDPEYQKAIGREGLTVKEYCQNLLDHGKDLNAVDRKFLEQVAASDRFGSLTVDHSIGNTYGTGKNSQVLVIGCGDGHAVMAVQGTNGTVEDWQNNSGFGGSEFIPEERWVASVCNRYADEYQSIDLTGHSQGGRESISAAMLMDDENRSKVRSIISNDGPGYSESFLAKYGDKVKDIEQRVKNIRPSSSCVGRLFTPIGDVEYVENLVVLDNGKAIDNHSGNTWYIGADGEYHQTSGPDIISRGTLTTCLGTVAEVLYTFMPEDQVQGYVNRIFEICDDGTGNIDFSKLITPSGILKTKDLIKDFSDDMQASLERIRNENLSSAEMTVLSFTQQLGDFVGTLKDVANVLLVACEVVTLIFPGAAVAIGVMEGVIEALKMIEDVVRGVEKAIKAILTIKAVIQERKKLERRREYLAANPSMEFSLSYIMDAAKAIQEVVNHMQNANDACLSAMHHVQKTIMTAVIETITNELGVPEEVTKYVKHLAKASPVEAMLYYKVRFGLNTPLFLTFEIKHGQTSANSLVEIGTKGAQLMQVIGKGPDTVFSVTPAALANAAANAEAAVNTYAKSFDSSNEAVVALGSTWSEEDYTSILNFFTKNTQDIPEFLKNLEETLGVMQSVAQTYSKFQDECVHTMQNIKLQ